MKTTLVAIMAVTAFLLIMPNISNAKSCPDKDAALFIDEVVGQLETVFKDSAIAYWKATTTGKKEWYKKYEEKELETKKILSDKKLFERVSKLKKGKIKDPLLKRQIDLVYLDILDNQIDPKLNEDITKKETALEEKFNTFRAKVAGKELTDNAIRKVLEESKDSAKRKTYWEASKQVGTAVSKDLVALVKERNKAAKELGFKDYYQMNLEFQEQSEKEVFSVLNELARTTEKQFQALKDEIDTALAKKFGIKKEEIRPWHYDNVFFQEPPEVFNVDMDLFFEGKDIVKLAGDYYASIGLSDATDVLKHSDLFERKGKEQHAYCIDIDRKGDVRILANVTPSDYWAQTMMHELGHAVYSKNIDKTLPYFLRDSAHTFTTEAVAEMFGDLVNTPAWLANVASPEKVKEVERDSKGIRATNRADKLVFARWVLVMANFERALYANPDQDLNKLWWDMVEKYQLIKRPEGWNNPDWAAKIHLATAPVYYHNYQLGRLFAAQMRHYIAKNIAPVDKAFIGNKELGKYLTDKVFAPGSKWRWDEFVKQATGEKFTAKYFAEELK